MLMASGQKYDLPICLMERSTCEVDGGMRELSSYRMQPSVCRFTNIYDIFGDAALYYDQVMSMPTIEKKLILILNGTN